MTAASHEDNQVIAAHRFDKAFGLSAVIQYLILYRVCGQKKPFVDFRKIDYFSIPCDVLLANKQQGTFPKSPAMRWK